MGQIIGIDLGTTYSCIAYLEGSEPRVISNLEGKATTPSVVSFTETGERLVGNLAQRQALTNPENTLYAIKRLMGKKYNSEEVKKAEKRLTYKLTEASNGDVMIKLGTRTVTPQEISSMILRYLKKCAESYFGEVVTDAVLTVPAHFDDHQRRATRDAASIAGLDVLRFINEPTSASLAYGLSEKKNGTVAVYDMGGGTFDISILEINEGIFHIRSTSGNSYLGGEDFDNRITDWLLEEFKKEHKLDLAENKLALQRLKEAAEKAKCELSYTHESEINLPFIDAGESSSAHLRKRIERGKLEELTRDLVDKTFPHVEQALNEAGVEPDKLDEIIIVGGQTRMPLIKKSIQEFFGKMPAEHINPDESVAMGAAIQSGILRGDMSDIALLLDITPMSLGVETENGSFTKIIHKNTTVPTRKTKAFTTVEDDQQTVRIHVLQGESNDIHDNVSLAKFDLLGIESAPAGVPQVEVTFDIDVNGIVKVYAKDVATGRERAIKVRTSSGLTQEELDKIIGEKEKEEPES
jgi:molecular chaperone DnaK